MKLRGLPLIAAAGVLAVGAAQAGPACDRAVSDASSISTRYKVQQAAVTAQVANGQLDIREPNFIRQQDALARSTIAGMVSTLKRSCQPGEIISVEWGAVVKQVCDFNKSVVANSSSTMCVMRGG